jgi:hypothetical protein
VRRTEVETLMSWNVITGPSRSILVTLVVLLAIALILVGPAAVRASADPATNRHVTTECCGHGEE